MKEELDRRQSSKARILALLQEKIAVDSPELNAISYRYGARLMELRQDGYQIRTVLAHGGVFRYIYEGKKHLPADLNTVTAGDGRLF